MAISTLVGLRSVDPGLLELGRSLRASPRQVLTTPLEIPAALPTVMGGVRVAVTLAVVGAIVGEWTGADKGLGVLINLARGSLFDIPLMFATLLTIALIGVGLYGLTVVIERRLVGERDLSPPAGSTGPGATIGPAFGQGAIPTGGGLADVRRRGVSPRAARMTRWRRRVSARSDGGAARARRPTGADGDVGWKEAAAAHRRAARSPGAPMPCDRVTRRWRRTREPVPIRSLSIPALVVAVVVLVAGCSASGPASVAPSVAPSAAPSSSAGASSPNASSSAEPVKLKVGLGYIRTSSSPSSISPTRPATTATPGST